MRRKPTNRTSYKEVTTLYQHYGIHDYMLRTIEDVKNIHNFDVTETTGYEDLTEENKRIFEAYVLQHMNSVGMNTKITMWPKSVHFVREYSYCTAPEWDEYEKKNVRWEIGREYIILKANGRTKKFKKYMDDDKTEADIDKSATTEKEFLRVDWRMNGENIWFHVSKELEYY